jgi:hypothetical protein
MYMKHVIHNTLKPCKILYMFKYIHFLGVWCNKTSPELAKFAKTEAGQCFSARELTMCNYSLHHFEYTTSMSYGRFLPVLLRLTASPSQNKCGTLQLTVTSNTAASLHRKSSRMTHTQSITMHAFLSSKSSSNLIQTRSQQRAANS